MLTSYDLLVGLTLLHERNQQQDKAISGWSGVLTQVANKQILIERDSLVEIVSSSKATRVIDHRSWLIGLMSYQGAIIPLVELGTLINDSHSTLGLKDRSILVVSQENGNIGLLVDKVLRSRDYWSDDTKLSDLKVCKKGLAKVSFSFQNEEVEVFDIMKFTTAIGIRREVVKQ
ncbi:MAG: chemotaxis protein CheW [Thiotrichaceae bacterium]